MTKDDLCNLDSHFAFGENWRSFADLISEERIEQSVRGLDKLFPNGGLAGRRFLDIGCGSGLSMLAALRLGAECVEGLDIDPCSVETARLLLSRYYPAERWFVREMSIFELATAKHGYYDVVHSWGVLHHTGDMWRALSVACSLLAPGGEIGVALYRRTPLCAFWALEKRVYSRAHSWVQRFMRGIFKSAFWIGLVVTRRSPYDYFANYKGARGMDWNHDVHDWLGGFPYESVTPMQVVEFLEQAGFKMERLSERRSVAFGLFGSHCDEFVARRVE